MAGRDQYMNFFVLDVTTGASSATLVTADFNTGAGVATQLAWRIHQVEWFSNGSFSGAADQDSMNIAISTRKNLTTMPGLIDKGCIARWRKVFSQWTGVGVKIDNYPMTQDYLPPILVATPSISIYAQGQLPTEAGANFAGQQTKKQYVRIGFTTEKLSESAYREVFETWNYAN